MYAVTVLFEVVPESLSAFLLKMRANASTSLRLEDGCQRFDICQDENAPHLIFLYELYRDRASFDAHLGTAHFKSFDQDTAAMVVSKTVRTYSEVWT